MDAVSHPQKRRAVFWLKVAFSLLPILALITGLWKAHAFQSRSPKVSPPDCPPTTTTRSKRNSGVSTHNGIVRIRNLAGEGTG